MLKMWATRLIFSVFVMAACTAVATGQESAPTLSAAPPQTIALTVPKDTPLQIVLDEEVKVKKAGQKLHGRIVQPIYAFDRVVVPAGTEVNGRIAKIDAVSRKDRTLGILNADFSPARKVEVEFDELVLGEGKHIPFRALVIPGSGQVMQLVTAEDEKNKLPSLPLQPKPRRQNSRSSRHGRQQCTR